VGLAGPRTDIWIALDPRGKGEPAGQGLYFAYARRKPGVSLAQAEADVKRVAAQIAERDPKSHPRYTAVLSDLRQSTYSELRSALFALFASAGLLLVISCANVATLLLARSAARARETAIRVALGASRRQLAMRYFAEAALVSLPGALLGIVFSLALTRLILGAGSEYIPYAEEIFIEWPVVAFGVALAFFTSVSTAMAPLWQAMRTAPNAVLTEGVRASAGARVRRVSHALVVAEIALAFTLLTVAAILVFHLQGLSRVATGFDPENLLTFEVAVPQRILLTPERVPYQQRMMEALSAIRGVTAATFANQIPLGGCCVGGTIQQEANAGVPDSRRVSFVFATPAYLETMRIPLRAGRFLNEADGRLEEGQSRPLPLVVNETAARRYWPDRNAIGARGHLNQTDGTPFEVIGLVGDVRNDGLKGAPEAEVYISSAVYPMNPMSILVRSPLPAERLVPDIRRTVASVDPTLAIHNVRTMNEIVNDSLQLERVSSLMMVFFALTAVLMATLGVYGVVAYGVRQRTVEIGTRMALGAVSRNLFTLIVGGGLKMAVGGIVIGAVMLVAAVWVLTEFLEVSGMGWLPFALSTALVGLVTATASYAPAWRASLLSPIVAIRDERGSAWRSASQHIRRTLSGVRQAVAATDERDLSPAALLSDFVAAARSAASFADALQDVLATLCAKFRVPSALLLEFTGEAVFRRRAAVGTMASVPANPPAHGFLSHRLTAYPQPLPFVTGELDALAEWAAALRPDRLEEIQWLAAADARMAVPLRTRTETLGVLLLGPPESRDHFSALDKEVLRACADQFALMLENARLTDRVVEQENVRRDLALAAEVQKRLLPAEPPSEAFAEFAAASVPARTIGGDYFDFIQTRDHQIGIALADVSGKGIAAALIMSVVQASLRIVTADGDVPLPRLAARLNEFLYRSTPASKYATFFYAQVDSDCCQLRYVNAGHNPPFLFRCDRGAGGVGIVQIQELSTGGTVVGMFPEASYDEAVVDLRPGDVLVAFTDGVPEAHDPANAEFGEERLKEVVREAIDRPAAEIGTRISTALKDWIRDAEQYDDLTIVVMKVR
jgi:predicted permease